MNTEWMIEVQHAFVFWAKANSIWPLVTIIIATINQPLILVRVIYVLASLHGEFDCLIPLLFSINITIYTAFVGQL